VIGDGWKHISMTLEQRLADDPTADALCAAAQGILDVTGVGLSLVTAEHRGPTYGSNDTSRSLEDLQFVLGEGPSFDAGRSNRPVVESELANPHSKRWPAFAPAAVEAGLRAVFSFPLQVGAAHLGALTAYQSTPGTLSHDQHIDALTTAELVTQAILDMQGGAPPGLLAAGLAEAGSHQATIHQASGMVSVQLDVSIEEALVRLRAHAYAVDRDIEDVASDVVDRRISLNDDGPR
jgi:hypothetical protein